MTGTNRRAVAFAIAFPATLVGCAAIAGLEPLAFIDDSVAADVETSDGPSSSDGGVDAFLGCASGAYTFCDDFEAPLSIAPDGGKWTSQEVTAPDGRLERDRGSMLSEVIDKPSCRAQLAFARPWRSSAGTHRKLTIEYRVNVESCPARVGERPMAELYAGSGRYRVILSVGADRGECLTGFGVVDLPPDGGPGVFINTISEGIAAAAWHDVRLEVSEIVPGTVEMVARIDGMERRLTFATGIEYDTFTFLVGLGLGSTGPGGRIRFDDVRAIYTE